ncbi:MAG: ABC transporter ATP-binding protein [Proteobacteria bacterium]|nr:ABC transporter ATP-binding protein [Pseudomonadota bacterium]
MNPASNLAHIGRIAHYAKPYIPLLGLALLFSLLFAGGRFGQVYLMKPLLDDVLLPYEANRSDAPPITFSDLWNAGEPAASPPGEPASADGASSEAAEVRATALAVFRTIILVGILIVVAIPIAIYGRAYTTNYVLKRINVDIKQELAAKLLRLPLSFHYAARSGDTMTRLLLDTDRANKALNLVFMEFLQAIIMVTIGLTTLYLLSWQLSLVTLVAAPSTIGVLWYFADKIRRSATRRQEQLGEVTQRLLNILTGIKVIKAFRGEGVETEAFRRETRRYFKRSMKVVRTKVLARSLTEMTNNGISIGVLMLGALLVLGRNWGLSAGDLAAFAGILTTVYKPIKTLTRGWSELMESLASAERFFEVLDLDEERADPPDAVRIDGVSHSIRFDHVSFSYGREPVLRDVSLEVKAGEVVALVGRTGTGKTTLVDLLLRFHDPDSGSIEIDGTDVRRIARESLLDHVAVVTQEPFLFDVTIEENVRYGRADAGDDEFLAACRVAHVDEFVDQLPEGYATEVGEFGLRLSGGQRQRITIARAILKNPAILVFDEATSALDAKTERTVQDAIDALRGQRTIFVIAHRLSTIRNADRIVVLEDGAVSQQGSHDQLMARGGLYRELVSLSTESLADEEGAASTEA